MSPQPKATYLDPLVGWRCWRVLPMQTLSGERRYRLCAAGTYGVPKVWEPKVAVVALCSSYEARHEAPHPSHECGLYAYANREQAEGKFAGLVRLNGSPGVSWAFGRVSLWGRVVECELGWRAQFAYPYDITVFTSGKAADALAAEYAVDVERRPLSVLRALVAGHPDKWDEPMVATPSGWWVRKEWYDKAGGQVDKYFLKAYHKDICRRLDAIARKVGRLERTAQGGDDDA